jgi:hypothetical protein
MSMKGVVLFPAFWISQLIFENVLLSPDYSGYKMSGRIKNTSAQFTLKEVSYIVTMQDCTGESPSKNCFTIGESSETVYPNVPPGQARDFEDSVYFSGSTLKPKARLEWHYVVTQTKGEWVARHGSASPCWRDADRLAPPIDSFLSLDQYSPRLMAFDPAAQFNEVLFVKHESMFTNEHKRTWTGVASGIAAGAAVVTMVVSMGFFINTTWRKDPPLSSIQTRLSHDIDRLNHSAALQQKAIEAISSRLQAIWSATIKTSDDDN